MISRPYFSLSFLLSSIGIGVLAGQGALEPTTGPGPSMKSLQEIWDKLCQIEQRLDLLEAESDTDSQPPGVAELNTAVDSLADALGVGLTYQWATETVEGSGPENVGTHTSLAFNPEGLPSISYHHVTDKDLKFAEHDGAVWDLEVVESSGDTGTYTSLAYSPGGHAAISYHSDGSDSLKFAWRNNPGSVFLGYTVRSSPGSEIYGISSELAFHPLNGRPYIVHRNNDTLTGQLAIFNQNVTNTAGEFTSANWTHNNLYNTIPGSGRDISIAFLSTGKHWISYGLSGVYDLRAIHNDSSFFTVDSPGRVGIDTSIAINSSDKPSIAYYDETNESLKFAEYSSGWSVVTVDATGNVGKYCSHAYSPSGKPAIAYYDATDHDLKYAERSNGVWKTYLVDSDGMVGTYCSLAFTSRGRPAISYYDETNGALRYAEAQNTIYTSPGF